ncbi:MAG TPA: transaldolase family protein, partial [Gammaproteobacteria bacterium]|nr:transaldolase family protein [Gammaproteobacteria bacterium]
MAKSPLQQLADYGQSVWIDYLSRDLVHSGKLERFMREDAVVGITSNPTIFDKALSSGKDYDAQLREVLAETRDAKEVFLRLAVRDIVDACDMLRGVYDEGTDGYVSMEVDPNFAYDTEATTAEVKRLSKLIDRPNLLVKIPATRPGLPAIED